jgi:hypothetical protein
MTYNDMISWALERTDVQTRSILDSRGVVIGSFRPEHVQVMYKLSPSPKYIYNKDFVSDFQRKECFESDQTYPGIIKDWWRNEAKFRADTHGIYATASLNEYMVYVAMMLCRLFGKKSPTHFPAEWVPLLHEATEGYSFNWDKILSDNIAKEVMEYQTARSNGRPVAFYMSAYIMDAICFSTPFPLMNWSWNLTYPEPIHEYHSKLWEENAKDSFYEICHFVVIPLHQMLYDCVPPRISELVTGNLRTVVDWFIEENFSYIRVFGCSIPPHALPKFLPDRLVCREVAHQIVTGGIGIELKMAQKKSWPVFPVQIGKFSLLNLGHSKVEAAALEEVKLVDLEHRKHDPYQLVGKHMAHCNMKAYEHEKSPCDDLFKGTRTYEEVLERVQTLSSDLQASFQTFQKHRWSGLPKVLQGEAITLPQRQEDTPPGLRQETQDKVNPEEIPQETERSSQNEEALQTENPETETERRPGTPPESSKSTPPSSPAVDVNIPKAIGETRSTELGSPIASLTPLQSTFGLPQMGAIYVGDLTPISRDEIPPSDYFFSKKRKVVLKQEMYMREGGMVKKHRVLVDGQNLEEEDFTTEVAGSMGAMATTNLFTVENMRTRIKKSNHIIAQLQDQLKNAEKNIREEVNKSLEQARAVERQEIQSLKTSLDEMNQRIQASQVQVTQQKELVKQLQAKLNLTEGRVVDLKAFQTLSLEAHTKIEVEQ